MCGECRFYFQNTGNSRSAAFAARITNPFGLTNVGSYSSPSFVDIDGDNFFEAIIGNGAGRLVFFESDILVPVEFTFFKGQATKAGNLLTWQTASEVNNEGFHIERSEDAKSWKAIGFVKGNGTTAETQDYSFLDSASIQGLHLAAMGNEQLANTRLGSPIVRQTPTLLTKDPG